MSGDDLTAAEKAYLESGGENVEGLLAENNTAPGGGKESVAAAAEPAKESAPKEPAAKEPSKEPAKTAEPIAPAKAAAEPPKPALAEAKNADEDDEDATADPKATVPYQKYSRAQKKSRDRIRALETELAEKNDKLSRGDERLRMLSEVMAPGQQAQEPAQDDDPEPDPNEDIIAWANWSRRENGRLREAISNTQGVVRDTNADTQMRESYQRDAVAFARETPDFAQAYNHLITVRAAMLQDQGYGPQEIGQIIHNEERGLVERASKSGKRPAAMIYALAKQMGYVMPAAPKPASGDMGQANGNATATTGAQPAQNGNGAEKPKPSVTEEIERIARGQAGAKSLSDAGGTPSSELTVEALANMSDAEFNAIYSRRKADVEALIGKRAH